MLKIVTWNINSVRLRLPLLKQFIETHQPDIICLQEIKVEDGLFPYQAIKDMGFDHIVYSGQKSYHGVAILSKLPIIDRFSLEFYNNDKRHIAIKVAGLEVHNFYVPAGGDIPDVSINVKFKHKLEYLKLMQNWFTTNRNLTDKLVITGDLNIAPYEHDVWSSKQLRKVVSHTDIEREALTELLNSLDFVDSSRHFVPLAEKFYTWWSYRNVDWQASNRGRRLDHIWVSSNLKDRMLAINALQEARSWLQPSDHVPYCMTLSR